MLQEEIRKLHGQPPENVDQGMTQCEQWRDLCSKLCEVEELIEINTVIPNEITGNVSSGNMNFSTTLSPQSVAESTRVDNEGVSDSPDHQRNHQRVGISSEQNKNAENPAGNRRNDTGVHQSGASDSLDEQFSLQRILQESQNFNKNLINIEHCKPETGSLTISKKIFSRWRDRFISASDGLSDLEKVNMFKRTAGSDLLDVLDLCPETLSADKNDKPSFVQIMKRLDNHFSSDRVKKISQMSFKSMVQLQNESSSEFLIRVTKFSSNCSFSSEEINSKIMNVIAKGALDRKVREKASELGDNGKRHSAAFFQDFLLNYELFKINERTQLKAKQSAQVFAVTDPGPYRNQASGKGGASGQFVFKGLGAPKKICWRCGSPNHDQSVCQHKEKECFKCHSIGHMQNMCKNTDPGKRKSQHTWINPQLSANKKIKIANVEETQEMDEVGDESLRENCKD